MTRQQMINKMNKAANKLMKNYSKQEEMKIWEMCIDWNSEHEDEEIFMCEHADDDNVVDGFYIEDDYWTYNE